LRWASAEGCRVRDENGREYLDLSAGFGVAALGHSNQRIRDAIASQPVTHALGDLQEAEVTATLREALPWPARFGVTGADAVELGLRTALLVTGKAGIVCFDGAYHGTSLLPLAATGITRLREPVARWLPGPVHRFPYGEDPGELPGYVGCVLVEPVQARGGARVPPGEFLETLRSRCDDAGALLLCDEIYCGLGRVGSMWPAGDLPHIRLIGKALGGGLPLSAALFVQHELADAWNALPGDTYTHTHMGNPLACAAALVVLDEVSRLLERVESAGQRMEQAGWAGSGLLRSRQGDWADALGRGVITIPAGLDDELLSATPPLNITDEELDEALERLA
jgi:4-aminobutyrate aminotransferase / (S)-3-amino-2-methylpropionate transaminase / 5-aminovalerate transaminase